MDTPYTYIVLNITLFTVLYTVLYCTLYSTPLYTKRYLDKLVQMQFMFKKISYLQSSEYIDTPHTYTLLNTSLYTVLNTVLYCILYNTPLYTKHYLYKLV